MGTILVFQPQWAYPSELEKWIANKVKGKLSLHMPCGKSKVGTIRADIDPTVKPDIICDMMHPPFRNQSFEILISDPPWKYYNKQRWIHRLSDLAKEKFYLNGPTLHYRLKHFVTNIFAIGYKNKYAIGLWFEYTRKQTTLDLVKVS